MNILTATIAALIALTSQAAAEVPLSGAEFDAYTRGKTLTYLENGFEYGAEQYRPRRKVRWAFADGSCQEGEWFEPESGLICFTYDGMGDLTQCWNFFRSESGLKAVFADKSGGTELYEARQSSKPLLCLGPEVGA